MNKPVAQVWTFASDSNPDIEYQTLQYADGTTSCNCNGWTRRTASDGSRSCKHTRWVDMKVADRHCSARRNYSEAQPQPPQSTNEQQKIQIAPKLGQRKFAI